MVCVAGDEVAAVQVVELGLGQAQRCGAGRGIGCKLEREREQGARSVGFGAVGQGDGKQTVPRIVELELGKIGSQPHLLHVEENLTFDRKVPTNDISMALS